MAMGKAVVRRGESREVEQMKGALTCREAEVLAQLIHGRTNKEIASLLGCSPKTIEFHVRNILWKCGQRSRRTLSSVTLECSQRTAL
jgi:DNA-binding NarL/FixJ family response regulator